MPFGHRLAAPERLDEYTRNEFERLIAAVSPLLSKIEVDPRDPNTGEVLYGQLGINASLQIQNVWNLPTLSRELGSDINTFQHEDRVLLQLRPSGAARTVHGFKAPAGPDRTPLLIVFNDDETYGLTLQHQSSSATDPRDRMVLTGGANITLSGGDTRAVWLSYSHLLSRWVQINSEAPTWSAEDVVAADLNVTNTTTQTSVYSYAIPANKIATGTVLELDLLATWFRDLTGSTNATGSNLAVQVNFGGTTLVSGNIATGLGRSDSVRRPHRLKVWILEVGANSQAAVIWTDFPSGAVASATWTTSPYTNSATAWATAAVDVAAAQTLEVLITHSQADATLTYRRHGAVLRLYS